MHALILAAGMLAAATEGITWEKDYDEAFAKAKERNVPVMLAFNMDGESANQSTADQIYRDPEFVARSRDFVCLIASTSRHAAAGGICSRFGAVTCDEHLKVEIKASDEFIGKDTVIAPQHLMITPARTVVARKAYFASKAEIVRMMRLAEKSMQTMSDDDAEAKLLRELMERAQERNAERRGAAIAELGRMEHPAARDTLFKLTLPANMDATRMEAIDALATKGNYDALPVLLDRLKDKNNLVVKHAIVALEKLELPAAVPDLMRLWKKKPKSTIAREIIRALAKCAPADAEIQNLVLKSAKKSTDTVVELSSIIALVDLETKDDRAFELLREKVKDRNGNVRGLAVWCLGTMKEKDAIPVLEALAADESNAQVRVCIQAALRNIAIESGPEDSELANQLEQFLEEDIRR